MMMYRNKVEAALDDLRQGKMVILTDNPSRENEGDLIIAAEKVTPEKISFMIRHCSGIICLPLPQAQIQKLGLTDMVSSSDNNSRYGTPFTVSIEAKEGVLTGVSAADRTQTILTAIQENVSADDIVKPGHIFPLRAKAGGVLERHGHTEGALDLVRIAGLKPAAVLCEVMNDDGTMAKGDALEKFANEHQIKMLSIDDIIAYRLATENLIAEETSALLPIEHYGEFQITIIKEKISGNEHIILEKKIKETKTPTLVRIHSSCVTGDIFGSKRCDCRHQLNYSLQRLSEEGGILIYLDQEGRGIGIFNKIKSYLLQEHGFDTIEANEQLGFPPDARKYYIAANFLRNKGITDIRLLTNNPAKLSDLEKYGIAHVQQESMPIFCNEHNVKYLFAKKDKLNHFIDDNLLNVL